MAEDRWYRGVRLGRVALAVTLVAGLAGPAVVSGEAGAAPTSRLAGVDRFATAAVVSAQFARPASGRVFVASGLGFADALTAAPIAAENGSPLLLVTATSIPPPVAAELDRLAPTEIVVFGATAVVGPAVLAALSAWAPVRVLAGADRFETAANASAWAYPATATTVFVASGVGFPDALSGGAFAGGVGGPVLLTLPDRIPTATATELARLHPTSIMLLGGAAAVSETVAQQLRAVAPVTRLAGVDRFWTSVVVAANFASASTVYLATGLDYPDALAGAALAGARHQPLLLATRDCIPDVVAGQIARLNPTEIVLLGADNVLGPAVAAGVRCS